jgi:hypothetical protein
MIVHDTVIRNIGKNDGFSIPSRALCEIKGTGDMFKIPTHTSTSKLDFLPFALAPLGRSRWLAKSSESSLRLLLIFFALLR